MADFRKGEEGGEMSSVKSPFDLTSRWARLGSSVNERGKLGLG